MEKKRGEIILHPRDLSLSSCNDERIKRAQPLWTLADILIHIRYTGKGKVQIKKTLSLSLSLSFRILLGIIYE